MDLRIRGAVQCDHAVGVVDHRPRDTGAHDGLTPSKLKDRCEVAAVALDFHHAPTSPCAVALLERNASPRDARICWPMTDVQQRLANLNDIKRAEEGAEGVAFATVWRVDGYRVVARAAHRSGSDWILQRDGDPEDHFVRLEVSGIEGRDSPQSRLREKVRELRAGDDRRPGVAFVVAFSRSPVQLLWEDVR